MEHVISESKLLHECDHPFIVRLVRSFEDAGSLYLLLELTLGGELFSVLRRSNATRVALAAATPHVSPWQQQRHTRRPGSGNATRVALAAATPHASPWQR